MVMVRHRIQCPLLIAANRARWPAGSRRPAGHAGTDRVPDTRRPGVAAPGQNTGSCADYGRRSLASARTVTATSATKPNAATVATMTSLAIHHVDSAFLLAPNCEPAQGNWGAGRQIGLIRPVWSLDDLGLGGRGKVGPRW
jgi:hypothetical protein